MAKVLLVAAVLWWKVREAVLAMVLSTPAMEREVSWEAWLTWIHITKARVSRPVMGEREALSLFIQLTVGVLSHQVVTWTW